MIHVVTAANRSLYEDKLDEMHRFRHEMYVEKMRWRDLKSENGREKDQFDNADAVYLLGLDDEGGLISSYRIMPTSGPYLLNGPMAHFVEGDAPQSEHIWDVTRWLLWPNHRRLDGQVISHEAGLLACGLFEFAISRRITHYTCLCELAFMQNLDIVGWPHTPLGLPKAYDNAGGTAIAILIDASLATLERTRAYTGIRHSVLYEAPAPGPSDTAVQNLQIAAAAQKIRNAA